MSETAKYAQESQAYLDQVHQAMTSGRFDKTLTMPDPRAARFSQAADNHRQVQAINKANGQKPQNAPEIIDLGQGDSNPQPEIIDLSGGQPEASAVKSTPFHPGKILDTVMSPIDPTLSRDLIGDAPKEYAGSDPLAKIGYGLAEIGHNILDTGINVALTPFTYLTSGMGMPQPRVISKPQLKILSAEERLGGTPVEVPRPIAPLQNPEGFVLPPSETGYKVQPTGRFVLPGQGVPSITDLAQAHQARMLGDIPTGAFHDPNSPPMSITKDTPTPARTDRLLGTESEMPETVQPFEKSRALRTAEEILQERQTMESKPLHGKRDQQIREANAYIPYGSSETASEGAALGATRAMKQMQTKANKLQALREDMAVDFAKEYVKERIDLQPATLKAPVSLPSGPLPRTFDHLSAEGLMPSVKQRITDDVLTAIGRFSPAWKGASESIRKTYEIASKDTVKSLNRYTDEVSAIFGERSWLAKKALKFAELTKGENIAIASAQRSFNITPEIEEAAFNYLYTNGEMQPPVAIRDQVVKYAETTYRNMLEPTSAHPGVRQIKIQDPWTGELFEPGQPSMFVAHQPIKETSREALKQHQWEALYNRMGGQSRTQVSLDKFIERVINFSKRDPELGVEVFNMPNLQQKRMVDLAALGGSPYQNAKKLGYETDIFSMAVRYRASGTLRGELELLRPGLDALKATTTGLDSEGARWLNGAVDYAMKIPHGADQVRHSMAQALQGARRWADITLLTKAQLTNLTQFAFPLSKSMGTPILGMKANVSGTLDYLFGQNKDLIQNSGALLPSVLNEFSHPTGPLAVLHANTMKMMGMSRVDKMTRAFAGSIGNRYIDQLERYLLEHPASKTHAAILNELGGPSAAKTILTEGKVNDELRLEMIQRFANETSGILDARGLPWYATSENPYAKVVLQYKPFLIANSTELQRSVLNAPTRAVAASRFAALVGTGVPIGLGVYEAKQLFNHIVQGPSYERPTKDDMYALEAAIAGIGGAYTAAAIDSVNDTMHNRVGFALPVAAYPSGLARDLYKSIKYGPGWRSLRTVSELPGVGLVTKPYVEGRAKVEEKQRQEMSR